MVTLSEGAGPSPRQVLSLALTLSNLTLTGAVVFLHKIHEDGDFVCCLSLEPGTEPITQTFQIHC